MNPPPGPIPSYSVAVTIVHEYSEQNRLPSVGAHGGYVYSKAVPAARPPADYTA
jgi:hypothetical protein